jgi:hypothetical protein
MRRVTWSFSLAAICALLLLLPLGVVPLPANAQGYHNGGPSVNLNIHWGPDTWGQYCRSDGYGHFWGRDRRYDASCWDNRHYSRDYHRDRWGRW